MLLAALYKVFYPNVSQKHSIWTKLETINSKTQTYENPWIGDRIHRRVGTGEINPGYEFRISTQQRLTEMDWRLNSRGWHRTRIESSLLKWFMMYPVGWKGISVSCFVAYFYSTQARLTVDTDTDELRSKRLLFELVFTVSVYWTNTGCNICIPGPRMLCSSGSSGW